MFSIVFYFGVGLALTFYCIVYLVCCVCRSIIGDKRQHDHRVWAYFMLPYILFIFLPIAHMTLLSVCTHGCWTLTVKRMRCLQHPGLG